MIKDIQDYINTINRVKKTKQNNWCELEYIFMVFLESMASSMIAIQFR